MADEIGHPISKSSLKRGLLFQNNNTLSHVVYFLFRAVFGANRICPIWGFVGLPEKEPWVEWHLLQRPGYQTTNKSDFTAADEVCLANRWWNELLVIKICELQHIFLDGLKNREKLFLFSVSQCLILRQWVINMLPKDGTKASSP